jgi:monofunctional biosynthetic peptidoglycan transglycosylase
MQRNASRARRSRWWTLFRWLRNLVLLFVGASLAMVLVLRFAPPPTTAFMLARAIEARRAGQADFTLRYRWVPWARLSPELPIALVAAEDQTFREHQGFDLKSIDAAWRERESGGRSRGASTISQQVAKNLFLWKDRSWVRKGLEVWFTLLIELTWPKRRILEVYANVAEFGDGLYGAEAAAQAYFGKPAATLTPRESALLAAVLPNPRVLHADRPSRYVWTRVRWIERQVRQLGGPSWLDPLR